MEIDLPPPIGRVRNHSPWFPTKLLYARTRQHHPVLSVSQGGETTHNCVFLPPICEYYRPFPDVTTCAAANDCSPETRRRRVRILVKIKRKITLDSVLRADKQIFVPVPAGCFVAWRRCRALAHPSSGARTAKGLRASRGRLPRLPAGSFVWLIVFDESKGLTPSSFGRGLFYAHLG